MGRSGVDLTPYKQALAWRTWNFREFLGGFSTNVAVAAAKMGHSAAVITGVGDDPFGNFVRQEMRRLGVSDEFVITTSHFKTSVTFCEIFPPDNFRSTSTANRPLQIYSYVPRTFRPRLSANAKVFLLSGTGLSVEPSRSAHRAACGPGKAARWTIADLDYRPMFWGTRGDRPTRN